MGTNYQLHLGKKSMLPEGPTFIWAADPDVIMTLLDTCPGVTVTDEYGVEMSLSDFINNLLHNTERFDISNVGKAFS